MLKFLRRVLSLMFWWLVVFACILFVGYIAWPLVQEKYGALCANPEWAFCRASWGTSEKSDIIQSKIEGNSKSFFEIMGTTFQDLFSDEGGKNHVRYVMSEEAGRYMPIQDNR